MRWICLLLIAVWLMLLPGGYCLEDIYEQGGEQAELYRKWREGENFLEYHFSPGYHPQDPDPFWDRVDKEIPSYESTLRYLFTAPKRLVWDTPAAMGKNIKINYFDTFNQSQDGLEITQDVVTGIPNTLMLGANGVYDAFTDFTTDVAMPLGGGAIIAPFRYLSSLTQGSPDLHRSVDWFPKSLYSIGLPIRKLSISAGDTLQKVANFGYRSITNPVGIPDHASRYFAPPVTAGYNPTTFVPSAPRPIPPGVVPQPAPLPVPQAPVGGTRAPSIPGRSMEPIRSLPAPSSPSLSTDDQYTPLEPLPDVSIPPPDWGKKTTP